MSISPTNKLFMSSLNHGKHRALRVLAPSILLLLTGCSSNQAITLKEVDTFQASIRAGADATSLYYRELNSQNRRLYFLLLSLDPKCKVGEHYDNSCKTFGNLKNKLESPLVVDQIPEESLNARILLLKSLASYAKALGDLANDSSPEDFSKGIQEIQTNFEELNSKFKNLSTGPSGIDTAIESRYITPISEITRILGSEYLNARKWSTIRQAIKDASPSITILLRSLKKDLSVANYIVPIREKQALTAWIAYYNTHKEKVSLEQRTLFLSEINKARTNYQLLVLNNPSEVIDLMSKSNDKLLELAIDGGTPKSIGELKAVLDLYIDRILAFKSAVAILSSRGN